MGKSSSELYNELMEITSTFTNANKELNEVMAKMNIAKDNNEYKGFYDRYARLADNMMPLAKLQKDKFIEYQKSLNQ